MIWAIVFGNQLAAGVTIPWPMGNPQVWMTWGAPHDWDPPIQNWDARGPVGGGPRCRGKPGVKTWKNIKHTVCVSLYTHIKFSFMYIYIYTYPKDSWKYVYIIIHNVILGFMELHGMYISWDLERVGLDVRCLDGMWKPHNDCFFGYKNV